MTVSVPANVPSDPPLLAVDAARLSTVASWPQSSMSAAQVARALTKSTPKPLTFRGANVALRMQAAPDAVASAARRAAFVGHASIAGIIGGVAAIPSWLLVSSHLPIFATGAGLVRLALAPPWYAVVLPAFVGAAILAVTAAFAAADVSSVVRRNEERGRAL